MRSVPFGRPHIDAEERDAVLEVLDGHMLVHGPKTAAFEDAFAAWTGAPNAVSVSSCTAAMHLVWFVQGIGPGDEVIVPAMTHTATAHAVELTGATPVFVDAEPGSGNIDVDAVEAAITDRTVGISIVHFLGEPADMPRLVEIARRRSLFLMEDCALAFGTKVDATHAGLLGDVGCFSFYPVKHMTTAEGGMAITTHDDLAAKLRHQRAFGVDRHVGERSEPGVYDVTALGFNYRMNEIEAAIGLVQVGRLDGFLKKRAEHATALRAGLAGVEGITLLPGDSGVGTSSNYCVSAVLDRDLTHLRRDIVPRMKAEGVGTSVYYPRPVPAMTYYADKYGHRAEQFPVAAWIADGSISLPVGPHLDADDVDHIIKTFTDVLNEVRA